MAREVLLDPRDVVRGALAPTLLVLDLVPESDEAPVPNHHPEPPLPQDSQPIHV